MICLPLSIHEDSISIKKEARKSNASEVEKKILECDAAVPFVCSMTWTVNAQGRDNEEFLKRQPGESIIYGEYIGQSVVVRKEVIVIIQLSQ